MDHRWAGKEKAFKAHRSAFDDLTELLEGMFEKDEVDYTIPSWSHAQADRNGANRKLQSIIDLIKE